MLYRALPEPRPRIVGVGWVVDCAEKRQLVSDKRFDVDLTSISIVGKKVSRLNSMDSFRTYLMNPETKVFFSQKSYLNYKGCRSYPHIPTRSPVLIHLISSLKSRSACVPIPYFILPTLVRYFDPLYRFTFFKFYILNNALSKSNCHSFCK
jgi:hypothetical protein